MKVETKYGKLKGITGETCIVYKGIPYAKAPIGDLRFCPPQPPEAWDGIRSCDAFGPMSIQSPQEPESFYDKEFYKNPAYIPPRSEDCLYLNIWTPKDAKDCPVAVWYHGGAFLSGHGGEMEFDGEAYARRGIILVTVNYRLGLLGYLCHRDLQDDQGVSGNWGLKDQIAALTWVRENIAAFGGNPDKITIFGQSAGAMSVRDLVCSPQVKGRIAGAIIQSGNGTKDILTSDYPMDMMEQVTERFLLEKQMTIGTLKALPAEALLPLQREYSAFAAPWTKTFLSLTPVVDGKVLPLHPTKACETGLTARVPYMVGATRQDIAVSPEGVQDAGKNVLLQGLLDWAVAHTAQGIPSYGYYFSRQLPGDSAGAFHSAELWYMFGTWRRCWRPMTEEDHSLSEWMLDRWADFIRSGNPGWAVCNRDAGFYQRLDIAAPQGAQHN